MQKGDIVRHKDWEPGRKVTVLDTATQFNEEMILIDLPKKYVMDSTLYPESIKTWFKASSFELFDMPKAVKVYPLPTTEGFYWAKWKIASDEYLKVDANFSPMLTWEVVQVVDNNGEGAERFAVEVCGVQEPQWLDNFFWGPEAKLPKDI